MDSKIARVAPEFVQWKGGREASSPTKGSATQTPQQRQHIAQKNGKSKNFGTTSAPKILRKFENSGYIYIEENLPNMGFS